MGAGLYLIWPAFYTDVTDSYRLGRRGRLRTDLGGLYFNAIVAVGITGLWLWLHYDALLLVVATQIIQMIRQLTPLVRFDGYHVLADLTGVPDLYGRMKPTLLGMLPWRWRYPQVRQLKWWARIVVTVWVIVVVPLLIGMLALAVLALPRLLGSAWAALNKQQDVLATAWADGDVVQAIARVLAMVAIVIPMAGIIYLLVRVARRVVSGAWRGTSGKPLQRAVVGVLGAAALAGIAYAWFPNGDNYRPIEASERGTLSDIFYAVRVETMGDRRTVSNATRPVAAARPLAVGHRGVMPALWDTRTPPPTVNNPQLAVILVPRPVGTAATGGGYYVAPSSTPAGDQGWVFPFDKPLAPEEGDNQALAVNTTDGSLVYDVAFAMVWVKDNSYAMNVNEAHAYASCDSCAAVAVAYQVVLVIDSDENDDNVAVPQNLAGALNYDCVNCMTYALARQLFVTIDRPLTEAEMTALEDALEEVWAEVAAYEQSIEAGQIPPEVWVNEIDGKLAEWNAEIMVVLDPYVSYPTLTPTPAPTAPSTATPSPTVAPVLSPSAPVPPPSSSTPQPTVTADATAPAESTLDPTTSAPTLSSEPTSSGTTPEPSSTTDPSASTDPTSDGSVGSTTGSTTGDTTSDGSTSGGTATSP